jgi:hypothetical protein|nr:MAG: hypothetical protein J07AB56_05180 [Candidatus Nanosalinarum sp. J07AB56]
MGRGITETETVLEPDKPDSAEEAYAAVANGAINLGTKKVTALSLDEQPKSKAGIYRKAVKEAGHTPKADNRFVPAKGTTVCYVEDSLTNIGLAAKETIKKAQDDRIEEGTAYSLTEFGQHIQPILAQTIKAVSEANELEELGEALGKTASSGEERSPMNRTRTLHSIRNGARNDTAIAEEHDIEPTQVTKVTRRLDNEGIIEKKATHSEGGRRIEFNEDASVDDTRPVSGYTNLTGRIAEYLSDQDSPVARSELVENGDLGADSTTDAILTALNQQGIVNERPTIELTEKGEEAIGILDDVATAVTQYMNSDAETLREALDVMPDYVNDAWEEYQENPEEFKEYTMEVWNASRRNSPHTDTVDSQEAQQRVEDILADHSEPVATRDIADEWENRYPKEGRSVSSVRVYLKESDRISLQGTGDYDSKLWYLEEEKT